MHIPLRQKEPPKEMHRKILYVEELESAKSQGNRYFDV